MKVISGTQMTGGYGGGDIISRCEIEAGDNQIVVIVGPNGAGKSTAMKALFGMLKLREGTVRFREEDITDLEPQDRVALGMAFVPQTRNVFETLSIEENLEMGAFLRKEGVKAAIDKVYDLFPALLEKRLQRASALSGGQRQQLAIARALMTNPRLLMLDEPTAGTSPVVMNDIFLHIRKIASSGIAIVLVEQNARLALEIADMGYVLVEGKNRYSGTGADLLANADVRKSFLGG